MPGDRDAEVDPRFDPVFQRGYDPKRDGVRRATRPPRVESLPAQSPAAESAPPPARGEERAATHPALPSPAEPELDEAAPPVRNPFRLILLLASLTAIAGAGVLLWRRIEEDPYGGYGGYGGDVGQVFVQQLEDALLAPLITGGLLGLCLWLALGAIRGRDRE